MELDTRTLTKTLEKVGRGDVPADDVIGLVETALNHTEDLAEHVYVALSEATWRLVSARAFDDELVTWFNAHKFASSLLKRRGKAEIAGRVRALADLVSRSHRFAEAQPVADVLNRKHVQAILAILARVKGEVGRSDLAEQLKIGDANLSRVLLVMTSNGLVDRRSVGREANFRITESGVAALGRRKAADHPTVDVSEKASVWWTDLMLPTAVWSGTGKIEGLNTAFDNLMTRVGCDRDDRGTMSDWVRCMRRVGEPGLGKTEKYEISDGDGVHNVVVVPLGDGGKAAFAFDVSDYRHRIETLTARISEASSREAELSAELHRFRHRLIDYNAASKAVLETVADNWRETLETPRGAKGAVKMLAALRRFDKGVAAWFPRFYGGSYIIRDGSELPNEHLNPRALIEYVVDGVKEYVDHDVSVNINVQNGILDGSREMLEQSLFQVAALSLKHFDKDQQRVVTSKIDGTNLILLCQGTVSDESWLSNAGTSVTDDWLSVSGRSLRYAKSVFMEHGGDLSIDVAKDRGARVRVSLPIHGR